MTARFSRLSKWRRRGHGNLRARGPPCAGGGLRSRALTTAGSIFAMLSALRAMSKATTLAESNSLISSFSSRGFYQDTQCARQLRSAALRNCAGLHPTDEQLRESLRRRGLMRALAEALKQTPSPWRPTTWETVLQSEHLELPRARGRTE